MICTCSVHYELSHTVAASAQNCSLMMVSNIAFHICVHKILNWKLEVLNAVLKLLVIVCFIEQHNGKKFV
jgi:hypothetical protein